MRTKICGITRPEDARAAHDAGADFMGLVFAPSPRRVDEARALKIVASVPGFKNWVAVFVNEDRDKIASLAKGLRISYIQLHGQESQGDCDYLTARGLQIIKAHRIKDAGSLAAAADYKTPFILLDSFSKEREGGTGSCFDWELLRDKSFPGKVFLSGGLKPESLAAAFSHFLPYAVDVSSGVEIAPGIKNPDKIRTFIGNAQAAEASFLKVKQNG